MIFYLLIVLIIVLLFIPHTKKKKEHKIFDIRRDVLSQSSELAKYLLLKN